MLINYGLRWPYVMWTLRLANTDGSKYKVEKKGTRKDQRQGFFRPDRCSATSRTRALRCSPISIQGGDVGRAGVASKESNYTRAAKIGRARALIRVHSPKALAPFHALQAERPGPGSRGTRCTWSRHGRPSARLGRLGRPRRPVRRVAR